MSNPKSVCQDFVDNDVSCRYFNKTKLLIVDTDPCNGQLVVHDLVNIIGLNNIETICFNSTPVPVLMKNIELITYLTIPVSDYSTKEEHDYFVDHIVTEMKKG